MDGCAVNHIKRNKSYFLSLYLTDRKTNGLGTQIKVKNYGQDFQFDE